MSSLPGEDPKGETLIEVLENIQEGSQELTRLSQKPSPLLHTHIPDPDRRTDYPRVQSPESHSPISGSRRSSTLSLSGMSESSLTSDGSSVISYDASKQPRKKILKNPHRLRKHSKNRVRWKLPGEQDSDTASLQSFDSLSTTSEIYSRAHLVALERQRNWKEFEKKPAHRSTGLAPARHHVLSNSSSSFFNLPSTPSPPSSNSLVHTLLGGSPITHHGVHSARSISTSSLPQVLTSREIASSTSTSNTSSRGFQRSLSPLTNSAVTSPGLSPSRQTLQSTPKPYYQSDSYLLHSVRKNTIKEVNDTPSDVSDNYDIDMPILKLDNSNLTDLEESTMEDRRKMHIFKFPSPVQSIHQQSGMHSSKTAPVSRHKFMFVEDDDAGDYDHLVPLKSSPNVGKDMNTAESMKEDLQNAESQPLKSINKEPSSEGDAYTDKDVDDALGEIGDESDKNSRASTSSSEDFPPLPMKVKSLQSSWDHKKEGSPLLSPRVRALHSPSNHRVNGYDEEEYEPLPEGEVSLPVLFEDVGGLNWQVNQASQGSASLSGSQETEPVSDVVNAECRSSAVTNAMVRVNGVISKPIITEEEESATGKIGNDGPHTSMNGQREENVGLAIIGKEERSSLPREDRKNIDIIKTEPNIRTGSTGKEQTNVSSKGSLKPPPPPVPPKPSPPPVPPKTKHIKRQDRDANGTPLFAYDQFQLPLPPLLEDSFSYAVHDPTSLTLEDSITHMEDILPPPPEFAFPSPPEFSDSTTPDTEVEQTAYSDEILTSPSSSTLVPDHEYLSDMKQILDTEQSSDRDACSSSSSSSPLSHHSNKHSWSVIHHTKVKERSGSSARSDEFVSPSSTLVGSLEDQLGILLDRATPSQNGEHIGHSFYGNREHVSPGKPPNSTQTTRHKLSMEMANTKGSLLSLSPHSQSSHRNSSQNEQAKGRTPESHVKDRVPDSGTQLDPHTNSRGLKQESREKPPNSLALKRAPNRPAPPPPVPPHLADKLSPNERSMLHLVYPTSGKPRMMKPVVHDTDKHIQEMLMELESGEENKQKRFNSSSYGKSADIKSSIISFH